LDLQEKLDAAREKALVLAEQHKIKLKSWTCLFVLKI
jgi:hypothetical protein